MIETANVVRYKLTCEASDRTGKVCGYQWEADKIPKRCSRCKRATWNRPRKPGGTFGEPLVALGRSQSITEWAKETGINRVTIHSRINKLGWTPDDAVTTPTRIINLASAHEVPHETV